MELDLDIDPICKYPELLRKKVLSLLSESQSLFGPMTNSMPLLGVRFHETGPCIRFAKDNQSYWIFLSPDKNEKYGKWTEFELSHEIIHCLMPGSRDDTILLEEGLACWFSVRKTPSGAFEIPSVPLYKEGYDIVRSIMRWNSSLIKKGRIERPNLSDWTPDFLRELNPNLSAEAIQRACVNVASTGFY
jgi:hypothetical protein